MVNSRIRNFTIKAAMARARVRRFRQRLALKKSYRNAVESEIQKRKNIDDREINPPPIITDSENTHSSNEDMLDLKEKIKCWAVKHCITKRAINDLLSILILFGFDLLPRDSRTLMKTPKHVDIRDLSNGQLWYHGITKYLELLFHKIQNDIIINLDFNFDGVEISNSSKKCFWPIISSIRGEDFINCNTCVYIQWVLII